MPRISRAVLAFATFAIAAPVVRGQEPDSVLPPADRARPDRAAVFGAELSLLAPRGDFRAGNRLAVGYGLRGGFGLGEGIFDLAGAFRSIVRDSRTYGDTSVNNMMRTLSAEVRLAAPFRMVRPYVGGSLGVAYFGTETSVHQCCDDDDESYDEFEGVRLARFTPVASSRVGLVVDLPGGGWGGSLLSVDLGVEHHHGGRASYQTNGRGEVHTTRTNFRVYSVGIAVRSRARP